MKKREKRRVLERQYFNTNTLYLLQIYERTCFKQWLNVGITSDKAFADKWKHEQ